MAFRKELFLSFCSILKPKLRLQTFAPFVQSSTLPVLTGYSHEKSATSLPASKDKLLRGQSVNCGTKASNTHRQLSKWTKIDRSLPHTCYNDGALQTIEAVNILEDEKSVEITWLGNTIRGLFPFVWLRDHCQCEQCFHPVSLSRTMLFKDLRLDESLVDIKIDKESVLEIEWSDGHISRYESDWLQERKFERSVNINRRPSAYKLPRIFWGSEALQNLPTANFQDLVKDDFALLSWLQQLEVFGYVLIKNAPAEHGQVKQLAERVAFIRRTHYGADFSVQAKPDPSNVAYSSDPLQLHTDLPYYDYKPGAQMVHCILQYEGVGAQSQVADGTHVAMELKRIHPQKFEVLSKTLVDWCDVGVDEGREFFKILQRPIICLDSNGDIERINFSHPQRDSFFNVNFETVFKWYDAMKTFHDMMYDPQYCLEFKMTPGDIQSFDNLRIVHGRRGYEDGIGERMIEGCYMDWDEIRSRRRVLEGKLNVSSEFWCEQRRNREQRRNLSESQ